MVSPGVAFLFRSSPVLSIPLVVGVGLHTLCPRLNGPAVPTWAALVLAITSLPAYTFFKILLRDWRNRRAAAALGARLVPVVKGNSIGSVDILKRMRYNRVHGYPADGLREAVEELGPIVNFKILWMDTILTTAPEHIKLILSTDFNNFVKGERFKYGMSSVLGVGVFNSDGEQWKFHRQMTRPFFSRDRISHFDIFDRHANDVISLLKQRMKEGYAVDFQDLIGRFTMDSASEFLFNSCVHSLKANLPYPHNVPFPPVQSNTPEAQAAIKFTDAFSEAMLRISEREVLGRIWPLFEIFGDRTAKPMRAISEYLDPVIEAAMEKKRLAGGSKDKINEDAEELNLLEELLQTTSDPRVLKDEILNMLLAGRDTTMHTLTVIVYFFTMYPDVCARVRAEVLEQVGPDRRPTYDDIKDMKYLRAVINETMRLYPSVPFNVREPINATIWPSPNPNEKPIFIPAGSKLPYSIFLMHRRKDLWGPDAEEFSPDRFLDERLKTYLLKNPFQYLPFNAGPRTCMGQMFAYNEMSFMIIRLLQAFSSFSLDEDAFSPEGRPPKEWASASGRKGIDRFRPKLHMTMSTADGLWIKVKEA
ncbi:cytochrome P450 monooxygenase pc-1 [Mycena metata]|uniref:Cytochrome P450 monooxygenase pc-1 n=1 Tax=Mycena metata TaxID=1033252 RepID=A0AAD7IXU5_9AGAR|nr:cytochrome P450 monooxygenase pc-1 [Mycena metata]